MKTLVIHPDDRTTDFLYHIYENLDATVINDGWMSEDEMFDIIAEHDRIICLGHGGPGGLFGKGGYLVSDYHADILRTKNLVFIWCNADQFMEYNGLKGFYSGMFISEVGEAECYNIKATQVQVDFSNYLFANLLGKHIDDKDRLKKIKDGYKVEGDKVVKFNNDRLYEQDNSIDWDDPKDIYEIGHIDTNHLFDCDVDFEEDIQWETPEQRWEEEYDCDFLDRESFYD